MAAVRALIRLGAKRLRLRRLPAAGLRSTSRSAPAASPRSSAAASRSANSLPRPASAGRRSDPHRAKGNCIRRAPRRSGCARCRRGKRGLAREGSRHYFRLAYPPPCATVAPTDRRAGDALESRVDRDRRRRRCACRRAHARTVGVAARYSCTGRTGRRSRCASGAPRRRGRRSDAERREPHALHARPRACRGGRVGRGGEHPWTRRNAARWGSRGSRRGRTCPRRGRRSRGGIPLSRDSLRSAARTPYLNVPLRHARPPDRVRGCSGHPLTPPSLPPRRHARGGAAWVAGSSPAMTGEAMTL